MIEIERERERMRKGDRYVWERKRDNELKLECAKIRGDIL